MSTSLERPNEIIVLIHGIRTSASWYQSVKQTLDPPKLVLLVHYGYLDAFRFWCPVITRNQAIARVARQLGEIRQKYPGVPISVLAHSFGTYAIGTILEADPSLTLHRVVLCGSILPRDFRWDLVTNRITGEVVNECGSRDIWPLLAQSMTWGFGDTGVTGFGVFVRDRYHDLGHSGFLNAAFATRFWVPWFLEGTFAPSEWESVRPPPQWLLQVVGMPVWKYALIILLLLVSFLAYPFVSRWYQKPLDGTKIERRNKSLTTADGAIASIANLQDADAEYAIWLRKLLDGLRRERDDSLGRGDAGVLYFESVPFTVTSGCISLVVKGFETNPARGITPIAFLRHTNRAIDLVPIHFDKNNLGRLHLRRVWNGDVLIVVLFVSEDTGKQGKRIEDDFILEVE